MRAAASTALIDAVAPKLPFDAGSSAAPTSGGDDEDDETASVISASPAEVCEDEHIAAESDRSGASSASSSDHVGRFSLDAAERTNKWARSAARS